ncbi:hypothetical protein EVAR_43866_1 [Eumeta japonica]|uniref:Uncharacterized protein n=1 Tax=Eumeta variegata TaxID=151549 RepID=A0A4C1WZG3_EUMVA|nr:hypothetical protein EVAR_43866_1 [Eumeta japonica]
MYNVRARKVDGSATRSPLSRTRRTKCSYASCYCRGANDHTSHQRVGGHRHPWILANSRMLRRLRVEIGYLMKEKVEGQTSMRATKMKAVTAAHGHSRSQRTRQCFAGLLGGSKTSDRKETVLTETEVKSRRREWATGTLQQSKKFIMALARPTRGEYDIRPLYPMSVMQQQTHPDLQPYDATARAMIQATND